MKQELIELRKKMQQTGIDVCYIPMDDFHQSEYVGEYFRTVRFISGFTGEGTLVIGLDKAALFTDGRYFIQAAKELNSSGIELMKMGEPGVPLAEDYISELMPEQGVLGFDGRCVDDRKGKRLQTAADKKHGRCLDTDLVGAIWTSRPALASSRVWILEERFSGESAEHKLARIRSRMQEEGAEYHIITSLDDIAWLLNLRGDDIPCNPVFLSYLLLRQKDAYLFANPADFDEETRSYLTGLGVHLEAYSKVYDAAAQLRDGTMLLETGKTNYRLVEALDASMQVIDKPLPTSIFKSVKNETEIANEKKAHIKDGVAVTKYMYFLKHAFGQDGRITEHARQLLGTDRLTEISGAEYLERLRREQDGFLENSFTTISAYGANAALPHYAPSAAQDTELLPEGMYLVDSGGQYFEGTTDITRTIVMGPISEEERRYFTRVCQAMLRLGDARFLKGCIGVSIDYAAREVFWKEGLNFNHGTGHGVGYLLNVHERPNSIRYRVLEDPMQNGVLEPGNIQSDEPGIYIEGKYGIRTENLTLTKEAERNSYGTFLCFEFLTMCPIDLDGIDVSIMEDHDIELLNQYHKTVYEKLSPYFAGEELQWLKDATREVCK